MWNFIVSIHELKEPSGYSFLCAGSVISNNLVLSASSCFKPMVLPNAMLVQANSRNYQIGTEDGETHHNVVEIIRRPDEVGIL